jgi:SAM-dependent methyltransferase
MIKNKSRVFPEGQAALFYGEASDRTRALESEPGFHNVLGFEEAWADRPAVMDFLDPRSEIHHLKALSTRLYQDFLDRNMDPIPSDATVLDAGCGIGRLTLTLAESFAQVVAFDPCRSSVEACSHHLDRARIDNVELHFAAIDWLETLPENTYDAVYAMELLCYLSDPGMAARQLIRVAKPNAPIFVSVEARPGGPASQNLGGPANLLAALDGKPVIIENELQVRFFTKDSLSKLLVEAGAENPVVEGSHYFAEGVFWQSLDERQLSNPDYLKDVFNAESACRANPDIEPWARVLSAVAKKPGL